MKRKRRDVEELCVGGDRLEDLGLNLLEPKESRKVDNNTLNGSMDDSDSEDETFDCTEGAEDVEPDDQVIELENEISIEDNQITSICDNVGTSSVIVLSYGVSGNRKMTELMEEYVRLISLRQFIRSNSSNAMRILSNYNRFRGLAAFRNVPIWNEPLFRIQDVEFQNCAI